MYWTTGNFYGILYSSIREADKKPIGFGGYEKCYPLLSIGKTDVSGECDTQTTSGIHSYRYKKF